MKQELQNLVEEAVHVLKEHQQTTTQAAQQALKDQINHAKSVLQDTYQPPFSRSRAFLSEINETAFAIEHYTMVPSYLPDDAVFSTYGLRPAIQWFKDQSLLNLEQEAIMTKQHQVIERAHQLLAETKIGKNIGEANADSYQALQQAVTNLENNPLHIPSIINCFDLIKQFQDHVFLRSDVEDQHISLFFTEQDIQSLKEKVIKEPIFQAQYKKMKAVADSHSLDYIEMARELHQTTFPYDLYNKHFYLWSSSDKLINFTSPAHTTTAKLQIILPACENETDGLGHVWIDNIQILSSKGEHASILNGGFDQGTVHPDGWSPVQHKGEPILAWEDRYPYNGGGGQKNQVNPSSQVAFSRADALEPKSIYICNPTSKDEGAWYSQQAICLEAETSYTLTFDAKIDGKLKHGIKFVILFEDEHSKSLDEFCYYFNRKSFLPNNCFALSLQCDALVYAFSNNIMYAEKVKHQILFTLEDFCQGAEHWLVTNKRPDGSDSYGAVQGGRILSSIASAYSLIKPANVFTTQEQQHFHQLLEYMLRYLLDLRDRSELTPYQAQKNCSNWQTDMSAGVAFMMLTVDSFPHRKTWLYNAISVLHAQLSLNVNTDGSWPESLRYHHAALERFAIFAKAWAFHSGDNWFETTGLANMFRFGLQTQTPPYCYFDNRIATPPFGDHALGDGKEFASYRTYMKDIHQISPELAKQMYITWNLAGKPFKPLWGEAIIMENLLGIGETLTISPTNLVLPKDIYFQDAGLCISRNKNDFFAVMTSKQPIGHGHLDQGSFIIYKDGIPIIMDSGIEGYFDSSTPWHISSLSHACMQFAAPKPVMKKKTPEINLSAGTFSLEKGWADVPRTSELIGYETSEAQTMIEIAITNPEGYGTHYRKIWILKEASIYLIRDKVTDFNGELLFSLPVAALESTIKENTVYSTGAYHIDLETIFLAETKTIEIETGRSTTFFNSGHADCSMLNYIRATTNGRKAFWTILYPKDNQTTNLVVEQKNKTEYQLDGQDQSFMIDLEKEIVTSIK